MKKGPKTSYTFMPEYKVWDAMVQRCTNPKNKAWHRYGGRGIGVCERWLKFVNFLADMGARPAQEMTLERRDNNIGYGPDNCSWATRLEQSRNTRVYCTNKSGWRGVRVDKRGKFKAEIGVRGKTKCLGTFATLDEAIAARRAGEASYWSKQ